MAYPHIKASEVKIGGFYLAANPDWPYVREVAVVAESSVVYNDYAYSTGEPGLVSQRCGKSRFAAWAGRELTDGEAARMKSADAHSAASQQAFAVSVMTPMGRKFAASVLALAVRNAVENFHAANTKQTIKNSDEYMPEFNRSVRNAIYTALHALSNPNNDRATSLYAAEIVKVPDYWEEPELLIR